VGATGAVSALRHGAIKRSRSPAVGKDSGGKPTHALTHGKTLPNGEGFPCFWREKQGIDTAGAWA